MTYPVFPTMPGQAIGITRSPIWRTSVQSALSGKEVRLAYMSYPLYQWSVDFAALRSYGGQTELAQVIGFINSLQGMAGLFVFTDTEDNSVTNQTFAVASGSQSAFQLTRTYGGYSEPVQTNITAAIYANGTLVTQGSGAGQCTVNPATGVVTFTTAPAAGTTLTWSGSFSYLCRLLQDSNKFTQEFINAWSLSGFAFQSVKF